MKKLTTNKLTEKQAFLAMVSFLERYYEQTKSDEIGALLGSLQLLDDEITADPAMWDDWLKIVQKTKSDYSEKYAKV